MAGKEMDSDLDFAFELQMKEAMEISLSLQPSSSHSLPFLLEDYEEVDAFIDRSEESEEDDVLIYKPEDDGVWTYPPEKDDVFIHQQEEDDFSNYQPDDDDVLSLMKLQAEEIERYERERIDSEKTQAEMRKIIGDLARQIHDQRLADEIEQVPEEQWRNYGDYYQRPYDQASSSSSAAETEIFRVYFKGLLSEETAGDSKVTFAAIGAAICDSRDNLIFESGKPLKGKEISWETAEFEALVEALNAALALNMKRVAFLCDDPILYLYFTGAEAAEGLEVSESLLEEVDFLQTKFIHCSPFLVARNDIKFVFKLARDAILSQITLPVEEIGPSNVVKETCMICLEDIDVGEMFSVDGCLHRFCSSCIRQHMEVKVLNGILVPKCPHDGCNSELNIDSCRKVLTPNLIEIMSQRLKETSMPFAERVYCPHPRCSVLMSKREVLEYSESLFRSVKQSGTRKCVKCHCLFCINCKVPWHRNMSCDDYKRLYPNPIGEAKLNSLASSNQWRQCVKCNHMIELAEGCYHMTCRCGFEFCYTCGAEWKSKKATCSCPIWDERNIIRD